MPRANRFNRKKMIQEDAILWLSKVEQGLNSPEKQALVAWLNQDKQHYAVFQSISNNHPILSQLTGLFPISATDKQDVKSKVIFALSFTFLFCLITASIINILSLLDLHIFPSKNTYKKEYVTQVGQNKSIELSDGSILTLNTNSIVQVSFSEKFRRLTLVQGEAQFTVSKDKNRPFTVFVGEQSFTALGTIFNIQKISPQNTELVVTEGTVLIADTDQFLANTENALTAFSTPDLPLFVDGTVLTSGQKIDVINQESTVIKDIALDQIQKDLAWQQGMLIFNGDRLEDVLTEVARYQPLTFKITEQQLKHLKVAGYFKTGDLKPLLTSLHYNFDISHKVVGDTVYLSSKSLKH